MSVMQGVLKALNVNKLTRSGVTFKFWCAVRAWAAAHASNACCEQ